MSLIRLLQESNPAMYENLTSGFDVLLGVLLEVDKSYIVDIQHPMHHFWFKEEMAYWLLDRTKGTDSEDNISFTRTSHGEAYLGFTDPTMAIEFKLTFG